MAHLRCDVWAEELRMASSMEVVLPDGGDLKEVPVVYLLHGLSDNCTAWCRYTSIERYARDKGVAVIMPEAQRSFYTDMALGLRYQTFLQRELPKICGHLFGLPTDREKNYIMGLSMGGYGALKCALTSPDQYIGCASFSAVTEISAKVEESEGSQRGEFQAIFGPALRVPPEAALKNLLMARSPEELPRFFVTCGEQDDLYPENCRFAAALAERGCDVRFLHWEGVHSWDFWDRSVEMAFHEFFPG